MPSLPPSRKQRSHTASTFSSDLAPPWSGERRYRNFAMSSSENSIPQFAQEFCCSRSTFNLIASSVSLVSSNFIRFNHSTILHIKCHDCFNDELNKLYLVTTSGITSCLSVNALSTLVIEVVDYNQNGCRSDHAIRTWNFVQDLMAE